MMKKLLPACVLSAILASGMVATAHAQDLNTVLTNFITQLLAGKIQIPASGTLTLTGSSQPLFAGAQTWNNAATTFIGFSLTITDTNSASGSLPVNVLGGAAGSTTLFALSKTGNGTFGGNVFPCSSCSLGFGVRSIMASPADGEMNFTTGAGSAPAALRHTWVIEANTGAKSPTVLECGETYTNTGDADGSSITLPNDPTAGCFFTVIATAAQTITVTASAGESLRSGTSTCGTSITIGTVASTFTVVATSGGNGAIWAVTSTTGTVTCNA